MSQVQQLLPLQCPDHPGQTIGMLSMQPDARKLAYCYKCIQENSQDIAAIQALKSIDSYLEDKSSFYANFQRKVESAGEVPAELPAEYSEILRKKEEQFDKFSHHIDQEREKVRRNFEEIRRIVEKIIKDKEEECLELLNKEVSDLSEAYIKFEKLCSMGWPSQERLQSIFPGADTLQQKMSQIESLDQLQAFMTEIQEDARIQDLYFVQDNGLLPKLKKKLDDLVQGLSIPEYCFAKIHGVIFESRNLENIVKDLMKEFINQEAQVSNPIFIRMNTPISDTYESRIIVAEQFLTLRNWLPRGYKFNLKLLFRGSADGMSSEKFHEKCDGKGATITLIKCRFNGAASSSIIGGFIDQSWHSNNNWSRAKEAFLFSLAEQSCNSVKCPILESQSHYAFNGNLQQGPSFGGGHDLLVHKNLKTGNVNPSSYSNAAVLRPGDQNRFDIEEIEVFQVR